MSLPPDHPHITLDNGRQILVCAQCERVRTIILLAGDRWLCTACRAEGRELIRIPTRRSQ